MGMYEVEQKFRVKTPGKIRGILKKMGARLVGKGFEKNELWDFQGKIRRQNSVLRLRESGSRGTLTFKGPRLKSKYKKRVEIETAVNAEHMRKIFQTLGYRVSVRYAKKREEYILRKAHVTIDQVKSHGWFVEIEASTRMIDLLAAKFGFSAADREERSYLEMIYGNRSRWAGK